MNTEYVTAAAWAAAEAAAATTTATHWAAAAVWAVAYAPVWVVSPDGYVDGYLVRLIWRSPR